MPTRTDSVPIIDAESLRSDAQALVYVALARWEKSLLIELLDTIGHGEYWHDANDSPEAVADGQRAISALIGKLMTGSAGVTGVIFSDDCILYRQNADGSIDVLLDARACAISAIDDYVVSAYDPAKDGEINTDIAPAWDGFEPETVPKSDTQAICGGALKAAEFMASEVERWIDIIDTIGTNLGRIIDIALGPSGKLISDTAEDTVGDLVSIVSSVGAGILRANVDQAYRDNWLCAFYDQFTANDTFDEANLAQAYGRFSAYETRADIRTFTEALFIPFVPFALFGSNASLIDRRQVLRQFIRGLDEPNDDCGICTGAEVLVTQDIFTDASAPNEPASGVLSIRQGSYGLNRLAGDGGSGNGIDVDILFAQPVRLRSWAVTIEHTSTLGANHSSRISIIDLDGAIDQRREELNEPQDATWTETLNPGVWARGLRLRVWSPNSTEANAVRVTDVRVVSENVSAGIEA